MKYCIKVKYLGNTWVCQQSPQAPLNPFPEVSRCATGTFLTRLDPIIVRNRQLSMYSFRIYNQITKIFTLN